MKIITYPSYNSRITECIFRDALGCHLTNIFSINDIPKKFDALLLQGGGDISPGFYGEKNKHCVNIDNKRDALEWAMIRQALSLDIPIMGICRGMQMVTIACGGSLYQDIQTQRATDKVHQATQHRLTAIKTPLKEHIPTDVVNSRHHQAVKTVPYGMQVLTRATDGIIEAIWRPGVLGVQWHPEDLFAYNPAWAGLFRWFLGGLK